MTRQEFKKALALLNDPSVIEMDYRITSDIFWGFGLKTFEPVNVTTKQVAKLIRWQCGNDINALDPVELNNIEYYGKKKFKIID